jgi:predicted transporter
VDGAFAFNSPGTAPPVGTYAADVTFTPTDTNNYNSVAGSVDVPVAKATPIVAVWPAASAIVYGQTLADSTLTGGSAPVDGAFAFNSPGTAPPAGTYAAAVTFTPVDTVNYNTVAGTVSVTVYAPATITVQPQSSTVQQGATVYLWVNAFGNTPLQYQWKRNGTNIAGATSAAHGILSAQLSSQGVYTCRVWNAYGEQTSSPATLTVNAPPAITAQPQSRTVPQGATVYFWINVTGSSPLQYQWRRNGVNVSGATSAAHGIPSAQLSSQGAYTCRVWNAFGEQISEPAILTVNAPPTITLQPQSRTVPQGATVYFWINVTGSSPLQYQWRRNGVNVSGATSAAHGIPSAQLSSQGAYTCRVWNAFGEAISTSATLTVNAPPAIREQPLSRTVDQWQDVCFWINATGSTPLHYQWIHDGVDIPGATSIAHGIIRVQPHHEGEYQCRVWNAFGEVVSEAGSLTVIPATTMPIITTQPVSRTVLQGTTAYIALVATGTQPLRYQWMRDDTDISGATAAVHGIPSAQPSHEGAYACRVSNDYGEVTSDSATLTVQPQK